MQVGCVIVPIVGAVGVIGCAIVETVNDRVQFDEFLFSVKV